MRSGPIALAFALSVCVFMPTASVGQMAWQTIHAAGDPKITLDIPAGINQVTTIEPKKGQLMSFFAVAGDEGLFCLLLRNSYSKKMTQKPFATKLRQHMSNFCTESGPTVSGLDPILQEPVTSNGDDAVACASVYTDSNEKRAGIVESVLTVPASKAIYSLHCQTSAADRASAEASWVTNWHDVVGHMQSSIVLPDSEK